MKQLTVYCSPELDGRVIAAFEHAGAEGFVRVDGAAGNKFLAPGAVPPAVTWEVVILTVPGLADEAAAQVVDELKAYAGKCEVDPCLRISLSPVEGPV